MNTPDLPNHVKRLQARPDIMDSIRHADEHPEELVKRTLPDVPEGIDWENPD